MEKLKEVLKERVNALAETSEYYARTTVFDWQYNLDAVTAVEDDFFWGGLEQIIAVCKEFEFTDLIRSVYLEAIAFGLPIDEYGNNLIVEEE